MASEREKLARDIDGLREDISLAWVDMISKPMAAAERRELSKSIGSLVEQLDDLQSRLDQLPKSKTWPIEPTLAASRRPGLSRNKLVRGMARPGTKTGVTRLTNSFTHVHFAAPGNGGRFLFELGVHLRNGPAPRALSNWQAGKSRLQCAGCRPQTALSPKPSAKSGATPGIANEALHPYIVAMEERKNDSDRRRQLELSINEALQREAARHEAAVRNMHRLRALRVERDQKAERK
jgi:hypothetical protein